MFVYAHSITCKLKITKMINEDTVFKLEDMKYLIRNGGLCSNTIIPFILVAFA